MAQWSSGGLKQTGFRGIVLFKGTLTGAEEDIPSQFRDRQGNIRLQTKLLFEDVELLAFESAIALNEPKFSPFINQSDAAQSPWGRMIKRWEAFVNDNREALGLGASEDIDLRALLFNRPLVWARVLLPNRNASPSTVYAPFAFEDKVEEFRVGVVGPTDIDTGGDLPPGTTEVSSSPSAPAIPDSVDEKVVEYIITNAGDGLTEATIKELLNEKPFGRSAITAANGVSPLIAYLTTNSYLEQNDEGLLVPVA